MSAFMPKSTNIYYKIQINAYGTYEKLEKVKSGQRG